MRSLGRSSRAVLATLAFAAFAGAFVTTPIVARGAADLAMTTSALVTPVPIASAVAVVLPRRDPFTGGAPRAGTTSTTAAFASRSASAPVSASPATASPAIPFPPIPPLAAIPATLGVLPPNAGAARAPLPFAPQAARVAAVVTGAHPFALVDEAGTTRVVTVGDRVAGDTVAAITAGGVRLEHGGTLAAAPAEPPARSDSGGR